jgi:hypothetical protein
MTSLAGDQLIRAGLLDKPPLGQPAFQMTSLGGDHLLGQTALEATTFWDKQPWRRPTTFGGAAFGRAALGISLWDNQPLGRSAFEDDPPWERPEIGGTNQPFR